MQAYAVAAIFATHGAGNCVSLFQVIARKFAKKAQQSKKKSDSKSQ
jgi:hypothetical protein